MDSLTRPNLSTTSYFYNLLTNSLFILIYLSYFIYLSLKRLSKQLIVDLDNISNTLNGMGS